MEEKRREEDRYCFACGADNPIGLHLAFREADGAYVAAFVAPPELQSYGGVVHGGIVGRLLDESMGRYLYAQGCRAVTAKLEVRYRRPTPVGEQLTVVGRILKRRGKFVDACASVMRDDGTVTAEATAKLAIVEESMWK